jgi:hypothetical protein
VNLSKLEERNLIRDNMYCEVRVSIFNFWNRSLQGVLVDEPDIIQIILFCCRRILLLSLDAPQNIMPYSMIEWK